MNPKKPRNTCTASAVVLGVFLLICAGTGAQEKSPPPQTPAPAATAPAPLPATPEQLLRVKRICVQNMGADVLGIQVQEMVIARLFESKRFSLTENCERADYVLKGSITERSTREFRSESEGIDFGERVQVDSSSGHAAGGTRETLASSTAKERAAVTLRLVDKDGEILWATSQESAEGKTKGAIGAAADQAVRRFLRDIEKAEKQTKATPPPK